MDNREFPYFQYRNYCLDKYLKNIYSFKSKMKIIFPARNHRYRVLPFLSEMKKIQRENLVFCLQTILCCCLATCLATKECHTGTGRCYWSGNGTYGQEKAESECQDLHGNLAVIETEELWSLVISTFRWASRTLRRLPMRFLLVKF